MCLLDGSSREVKPVRACTNVEVLVVGEVVVLLGLDGGLERFHENDGRDTTRRYVERELRHVGERRHLVALVFDVDAQLRRYGASRPRDGVLPATAGADGSRMPSQAFGVCSERARYNARRARLKRRRALRPYRRRRRRPPARPLRRRCRGGAPPKTRRRSVAPAVL